MFNNYRFSTKPREKFKVFEDYFTTQKTDFIHSKIDELYKICSQFKFVTSLPVHHSKFEHGFVPIISGKKNEVPNLLLQVSVSF